ncbi:hypothetical protein BGZ94_009620 [Podila epigama]|nr:hypothetical protein BGZ94_009620 [Podila epigama]
MVIIGAVFFARRPDAVVPALPEDMIAFHTSDATFNPYTAWEHLEAITKEPHNFNMRANTDVTRKYILEQLKVLQAEAIAAGRRNVRFDDQDNTTWTKIYKSKQQRQEEEGTEGPSSFGTKGTLEPELVEYVQGDNLLMWVGGVTTSEEDGIPVKIEIDLNQENQNALLVSSHYGKYHPSIDFNGATDDGGGVAVMLALIRHFIHHPVQHTIIFLFNNAEEEGCMGAGAFMGAPPNSTEDLGEGHPWKKYVKAVINLEGAGSGGPSLLFRASDYNIIRYYSDNAPYPHASVLANSAFDARLIQSETDYFIYNQHNLPGLDIAFYQRRSMYHTTTDWLPIESLHHMGSNVQATIIGLCNSAYLDTLQNVNNTKQSPMFSPRIWFGGRSVFYDVLGQTIFLTDLWTWLLANLFGLGLGLPVLTVVSIYVGWAIASRKEHRRRLSATGEPQRAPAHSLRSVLDSSSISQLGYSDDGYSPISQRAGSLYDYQGESGEGHHGQNMRRVIVRRYIGPVVRTTFLIALIVGFNLATVAGLSTALQILNPMVRFSSPWIILFEFGVVLLFVNTFLVYLFTVIETTIWGPVPIVRGANQWTFALGVWWWLIAVLVGTGVACYLKTGAFYGTTTLALFAGAAGLLQIVFCSWAVPEGAEVYAVYGIIMIPIVLGAIPAISRARNFKKALFLELLEFNQTDKSSAVTLATYSGPGSPSLYKLVQNIPTIHIPDEQHGNLTAGVAPTSLCKETSLKGGSMVGCTYTPERQIFEDEGWDQPIHADWLSPPKRGFDGWTEGQLQIQALETRMCTVRVAQTPKDHETQLLMDALSEEGKRFETPLNHRPKSLNVFLREWNRPWLVTIRVKGLPEEGDEKYTPNDGRSKNKTQAPPTAPRKKPDTIRIQILCRYDDWVSNPGYATEYNTVRTHIPEWARMWTLSRHLVTVGMDVQF